MDRLSPLQQGSGASIMVSNTTATEPLTTEQHMTLHGTRADVLARIALVNLGYLRGNKQGLRIAEACDEIRDCVEELEALVQSVSSHSAARVIDESKFPPRPTGSNDVNTDPDSPLIRYGRAKAESGVLLEPMDDGYWTPWHIANGMLRNTT